MDDTVHHTRNVIRVNSLERSKMVECGMSTIDEFMAINEDSNEDRFGTIRSDVVNNLHFCRKMVKGERVQR